MARKGALLMVTHDRYFFDRVVNRTLEIDGGKGYVYVGNYSLFLQKREERRIAEASAAQKLRNIYRRELAWISRGAEARRTKKKDRVERFAQIEAEVKNVKTEANLEMSSVSSRLGKTIIELEDIGMVWDGKDYIKDFSYILLRNDRIGIVGPNDAEYIFYKDYPRQRLEVNMPEISSDDIIMIGSYFAITPVLRDKVKELLDRAHDAGAIIYYDVNFRSTHANEAIKLMPTIIENFEYADILRGSTEDFQNMFRQPDADKVYSNHVGFYCPNFICTDADGDVRLRTKHVCKDYPVTPLKAVSTIGAGDNFNAGVVYGLLKYRVRRADLAELTEADWDAIIRCGMDFSADVCKSVSNSVSKEFAESYR